LIDGRRMRDRREFVGGGDEEMAVPVGGHVDDVREIALAPITSGASRLGEISVRPGRATNTPPWSDATLHRDVGDDGDASGPAGCPHRHRQRPIDGEMRTTPLVLTSSA
jgi:hypothetical protein